MSFKKLSKQGPRSRKDRSRSSKHQNWIVDSKTSQACRFKNAFKTFLTLQAIKNMI